MFHFAQLAHVQCGKLAHVHAQAHHIAHQCGQCNHTWDSTTHLKTVPKQAMEGTKSCHKSSTNGRWHTATIVGSRQESSNIRK